MSETPLMLQLERMLNPLAVEGDLIKLEVLLLVAGGVAFTVHWISENRGGNKRKNQREELDQKMLMKVTEQPQQTDSRGQRSL